MRFETVGVRVTDLPRTVRFYTKGLGFQVIRRDDCRNWGGGVTALLRDPRSGQRLELNWYPKQSMFEGPYKKGDELDHLDFTVGAVGRGALEKAYRRLLRIGAKPTRFSPVTTDGWGAMVRDPDGIWVRLGRRPRVPARRSRK